jgi:D-alanyl-D-alanine carboxypeptidase/D-alanyl-D-alanine-endopeptidase (penicillin-binding protein 4)
VVGLNFHSNCLAVYLQPATPGQSPLVQISPYVPSVGVNNQAVTGQTDTFSVGRQLGGSDLLVRGTIRNRRFDPVMVTVPDPAMMLGEALQHRLRGTGVTVGPVQRGDAAAYDSARVLHAIQSTMPLVLARCNKDSANLYAEALLKRAGQRFTGLPGSWPNGAAAVRAALAQRLGPRAAIMQIDDGSGLSRGNRVTARLLVELLAQVHAQRDTAWGQVFLESLSVAGEDGTLRRRQRLSSDMPALVIGKSGYINAVTTLSGYLILPSATGDSETAGDFASPAEAMAGSRVVSFSLLFNNYRPPIHHHNVRELQDRVLRLIARRLAQQETADGVAAAEDRLGG